MKVFDFLSLPKLELQSPVVTIGVFDGVHRGHQALLQTAKEMAGKGDAVAITFARHPLTILQNKSPQTILPLDKRLELFRQHGMTACGIIEFDEQFAGTEAEVFVAKYLVEYLHIRGIVVGDNFHFGRGGTGTPAMLESMGERHGFQVVVLSCLKLPNSDFTISSTNIRNKVQEGDMKCVRQMLGRPFSLIGRVIKGAGRGHTLGYPTANLELLHDLRPPEGVYGGCGIVDGVLFPALVSVGKTPTFGSDLDVKIEVFFDAFEGDLYERIVECYVFDKIRDQRKFAGIEELKCQVEEDRQRLLKQFNRYLEPLSQYERRIFVG